MHSHYTSCFHGYYDQFNNYFLRGQIKEKLKKLNWISNGITSLIKGRTICRSVHMFKLFLSVIEKLLFFQLI